MIGLEETMQGYVDSMLEVMAEVGRVLRDDGVLWVNLGDSYGAGNRNGVVPQTISKGNIRGMDKNHRNKGMDGQLLMIPARFALAMQDNGWTLRSDVIWSKKSCMPESMAGTRWDRCRIKTKGQQKGKQFSVMDGGPRMGDMSNGQYLGNAEYIDCTGCDKCNHNDGYVLRQGSWRSTSSHEHIFQLTKGMNYYSDGEAVKTAYTGLGIPRPFAKKNNDDRNDTGRIYEASDKGGANRRDVWRDISPEPYAGEHFATFPPDLPRLCIQASTSEAGVCGSCGNQWARVVDSDRWKPTCDCNADKIPATVLDPFAGTGTTLLAAQRLGRSGVGVDLSEDYLNQAVKRLSKETLPMVLI
tara:strand:+ start:197 stop:1264 length:1068 start_codon:yes stop_codon:yes gene_type:complete